MSLFHGTREWIYTRAVSGRYQTLHRLSGVLLISFLLIVPWIHIGEHPAVLADIPARRFYLLGHVYTASDGFLIVLAALLAAFGLFLISALFGRLWCGYLCPQTVFLEEWVRRIEYYIEGDGAVQKRRDKGPRTVEGTLRRAATVVVLGIHAFALGMTVVSYFAGAWTMWTGAGSTTAYAMVGVIFTGMMADWLWFREQLCIYLCPYARFQSTLTDDHSLTVAYDASVPIMKGKAAIEAGACIDCKKCVTTCPMGIDIRDGFQLECINCARCVDACTGVMDKLDRPSLVTYTTIAAQEGRPARTIRPRTLLYTTLVTGLSIALVAGLTLHNPIEMSVQRAPGTLYQLDEGGMVRNTYLLRIVNNNQGADRDFQLAVTGLPGAEVEVPALHLQAEESRTIPLVVRSPVGSTPPTTPITVTLTGGDRDVRIDTTFKAPGGNG